MRLRQCSWLGVRVKLSCPDVMCQFGTNDNFTNTITHPAQVVLETFPEGSLKVLTSGSYRGPSGGSQGTNTKIDDLM